MMTKIKWFKEVLEMEPGSKVFFPLARLYFDDGNLAEAMLTLRHGLERNPDHLEARFMLVEILCQQGQDAEAAAEVRTITGMLSSYPSFWKVWAQESVPTSRDSATALSFLAANFQGAPISWSQVIEKGMESLVGGNGAADKPKASKKVSKAPASAPVDPNMRTRTMADLLADQGDFRGALDIYEELFSLAPPSEGAELEALIEKMRLKLKKGRSESTDDIESVELPGAFDPQAELDALLGGDDDGSEIGFDAEIAAAQEPQFDEEEDEEPLPQEEAAAPIPGREKMLSTLEALAERLEARAAT